jgi:hypothetical protein
MKRFHVHVSVHLGIQAEDRAELEEVYGRLQSGESTVYGHDPVRTEPLKAQEATCGSPQAA